MIRTAVFIFCFILLQACNNDQASNGSHDVVPKDHSHAPASNPGKLLLNNGQKWKSDASTDKNVIVLSNSVQQFQAKQDPSTEEYRVFANELQAGIDTMIKECRMKGPDHDALHQWLEPLMKNIRDLELQAGTENAAELVKDISKKVDMYSKYFAAS